MPRKMTAMMSRVSSAGCTGGAMEGCAGGSQDGAALAESEIDVLSRREIQRAVSHVFTVSVPELNFSRRGKAPVALARQAAMYVAHVGVGLTMTEVGELFRRDRTTVAHACAVIEDLRDEPGFDYALQCLEGIVRHHIHMYAGQHPRTS